MLNIGVLDDNLNTLENYKNLLSEWFLKHNIKGNLILASTDPDEFMKAVKTNTINVCIIDINLRNEVNGMYLAEQVRDSSESIDIIFFTGCLDFVFKAFEIRAYRFICKPEWDVLEDTLVKLSKEKVQNELLKEPKLQIKCNSEVYFVPKNTINYIAHLNRKTIIYTKYGEHSTYESLEELESRISDTRFKRCHRSALVNCEKIYCIDFKNKKIKLLDGTSCDIGPKYISGFEKGLEP
ncbi:LytTR family two component transcriptional regulator [Ruminiclostridium sufflavum DSM 19573]|uniref:Stage 0 sporulation protein A homolog n=1 Tax=Ruminiclostridium sufflavum DSM 19573 TaxID=1121337 RepID=A0A318XLL0_9FIRM|nr:LytTR family DNA-binding domain-containing protein [Ruminiclostridium sufflavum]PYG88513.1 LytTR family two component transcriptional regulator [Ruminiclostridium sufflavum DSM 19573]